MQKKKKTNTKTSKKKEKPIHARLLTNRIVASAGFDTLLEKNYGKAVAKHLELSFAEALYLMERGKLSVAKNRRRVQFSTVMSHAMKKDLRLHEKYAVYRDLRDRGLVVKTGFKFGCDFRVYQRGVTVKRGPKAPSEHTKWVVYAVPEDYTCSFQELSRAVRLAHSIRATMLWAIVDSDADVTFFEIMRKKP